MNYLDRYAIWLNKVTDDELKNELTSLKENQTELENRFSAYLQFGTAGLRGILGVGTNNMNVYTVTKATLGVAQYLKDNFKKPQVVVCYDNRRYSRRFATLVSEILAGFNIHVFLFGELTPTPILSYTVRTLGATLGINITSSHNAKMYNGYKVVNASGSQIESKQAAAIAKYIESADEFALSTITLPGAIAKGLVEMVGQQYIQSYLLDSVPYLFGQTVNEAVSVVYTPFNGTGANALLQGFQQIGLTHLFPVAVQMKPDENFTTVPNPNPELFESYKESLKVAKKVSADIIVATDPDCDRLGVVVHHGHAWVQLTGDQLGVILLNAILSHRAQEKKLNKNSFMVMSVVSSDLSSILAESYGVKVYKTLTGFKNIGNKVEKEIAARTDKGLVGEDCFVFAYEESCGYMASPNIRDKDGIVPSLLLVQLANRLKSEHKTLVDYLQEIYLHVGVVLNHNYSFEYPGLAGIATIANKVEYLRKNPPALIGKWSVNRVTDYLNTKQTKLESQNFLEYELEFGKVIIRPSGTEPKLKVYLTAKGMSQFQTKRLLKQLTCAVNKLLKNERGMKNGI